MLATVCLEKQGYMGYKNSAECFIYPQQLATNVEISQTSALNKTPPMGLSFPNQTCSPHGFVFAVSANYEPNINCLLS